MVKLYYTTSSCGAANFIAAFSAGVTIETEQVNIQTHLTSSGKDFYTINPKGNVPTVVLDDGTYLNENAATLQYIADLVPGKVAPLNGTKERYLMQNALNWVSSELHASCGGLFDPTIAPEVREYLLKRTLKKVEFMNNSMVADKKFLVADMFTAADAYAYIVLSWFPYLNIDLSPFPAVLKYFEGIKELPNVKAAHERMASNPPTAV